MPVNSQRTPCGQLVRVRRAHDDTPGAKEVFDSFTDAQRRDYIDWVTSAKREATREKRVATAAEWISEGKRRNWKYENC